MRRHRHLSLLPRAHAGNALLEALDALRLRFVVACAQLENIRLAIIPRCLEHLSTALEVPGVVHVKEIAPACLQVATRGLLVRDDVHVLEVPLLVLLARLANPLLAGNIIEINGRKDDGDRDADAIELQS
eukprot:CAMPEP_0180713688 /NCGR_PEP_ID=MMETSP1038_2-20121128/12034_1 /TAXON_ID=632150 /ORGANISM="Azadinium spinosum, Strain 3D9" /LENGTH=129 /DNA_ID=CAMNT_0022746027 /DNA_START=94 /DNA_END=480 /DNA_ORIENTATION=+